MFDSLKPSLVDCLMAKILFFPNNIFDNISLCVKILYAMKIGKTGVSLTYSKELSFTTNKFNVGFHGSKNRYYVLFH